MRRHAFVCAAVAGAVSGALRPRAASATGGLEIAQPSAPSPAIRILLAAGAAFPAATPIDDESFEFAGHRYRGRFADVDLGDGRHGLVAEVPIEAYLYGVVGREMPPSWPAAALQAQAIISRSYAMSRMRPERPFDVVGSDSDQAYGDIAGESVAARAAVDATTRTILSFEGTLAEAVYSSCCGGHTASAADAWNHDIPYLRSFVDPNCAGTPRYRWRSEVAWATFARAFSHELDGIGTVRSIALGQRDDSGRARTIAFTGERSVDAVAAAAFRRALGTRVVRSTLLFAIGIAGNAASSTVTIDGGGNGHGVGMCQWGARGLALAGRPPAAILAFYFPGAALDRG
ncbi:MAG: SpoIID/LytB domain-containing protein [Vulcanimicrobiaceae bacterium]